MGVIEFLTGTDDASMTHVGWGFRIGGALLLVLWLAWGLARPRQ